MSVPVIIIILIIMTHNVCACCRVKGRFFSMLCCFIMPVLVHHGCLRQQTKPHYSFLCVNLCISLPHHLCNQLTADAFNCSNFFFTFLAFCYFFNIETFACTWKSRATEFSAIVWNTRPMHTYIHVLFLYCHSFGH